MQLFFVHLLKSLEEGYPISLATLVQTRGSTPQVPGASAIFSNEGLVAGTLGGGVMEGEMLTAAKSAITSGESLLKAYDMDADIADNAGPICGGYATVLIDPRPHGHISVFKSLTDSLNLGEAGVLVTMIKRSNGQLKEIHRTWIGEKNLAEAKKLHTHPLDEKVLQRSFMDRKTILSDFEESEDLILYQPLFPDPHLIIVGAGHIGKALSHQGKLLDFKVTVIDDRPEHANRKNLPDADVILSKDIERDLSNLSITDNCYIVIVTQGHTKDGVALKQCIHSKAAYIGMIGSKRKTRLMKEDFLNNGWATREELDRIHAPIGIDIHSETVQEIAVSIAGELVKVRHEHQARQMGKDMEIIVLAAGKSTRMGQQKLLMSYNGASFIENIIQTALDSRAGTVHVVVGSHSEEVMDQIGHLPVKIVFNKAYEKGMLSSVQSGFNALSASAKAGIVMLGDQPMVQSDIINRLIDAYIKYRKGIVVPVHKGKRGHPILIGTRYFVDIKKLDHTQGLRQLMRENAGDIHEVEVDSNTILKDIDTIEEYKKELI